MKIRISKETDQGEILKVHEQAFGEKEGPEIAVLVDDLLHDDTALPMLSLVAEEDEGIVGHILFTRAFIAGTDIPITAQLLAPLAVLPEMQGQGIGQNLIHAGLDRLRDGGTELVFVLGHPTYYPRCGFMPAGAQGFDAPYPIAEKNAAAWMILQLNGDIPGNTTGMVQCADALNKPQYWQE